MAFTLIKLNWRLQFNTMLKQWWRIILLAIIFLYFILLLFSAGVGFLSVGALGSPGMLTSLSLLYSLLIFILVVLISYFGNGDGQALSPQTLVYYLAPSEQLATALRRASMVSLSFVTLFLSFAATFSGYVSLNNGDLQASFQNEMLASSSQQDYNSLVCVSGSAVPLWLLLTVAVIGSLVGTYLFILIKNALGLYFSRNLSASVKNKRQAIQGIAIMAIIAGGYVVFFFISRSFSIQSLPKMIEMLAGPIARGFWFIAALSPLAPFSVAPLLSAGAFIPAGIAVIASVIWINRLLAVWPRSVENVMMGKGQGVAVISNAKQVKLADANAVSHLQLDNVWRLPRMLKYVGLKKPGQMLFSRYVYYMFKNPAQIMALFMPIYIGVILIVVQFINSENLHSTGRLIGFIVAISLFSSTVVMSQWSWDSSAYWYQMIAALPARQDRLARLLALIILHGSQLLVITFVFCLLTKQDLTFTLYGLAWCLTCTVIAYGIQMLWSALIPIPGPGPKDGITKNSNAGSMNLMLMSIVGMLLSGIAICFFALPVIVISYLKPAYLPLSLVLGIVEMVIAWSIGVIGGAAVLRKREVANFRRVLSWAGHTYNL